MGFHRYLTWGLQGQSGLSTAFHRLGCGLTESIYGLGICCSPIGMGDMKGDVLCQHLGISKFTECLEQRYLNFLS